MQVDFVATCTARLMYIYIYLSVNRGCNHNLLEGKFQASFRFAAGRGPITQTLSHLLGEQIARLKETDHQHTQLQAMTKPETHREHTHVPGTKRKPIQTTVQAMGESGLVEFKHGDY